MMTTGLAVALEAGMSDEARLALLQQLGESIALLHEATVAQENVLWATVVFFYDNGISADDLASAVGVSLPTFWRRIRPFRTG